MNNDYHYVAFVGEGPWAEESLLQVSLGTTPRAAHSSRLVQLLRCATLDNNSQHSWYRPNACCRLSSTTRFGGNPHGSPRTISMRRLRRSAALREAVESVLWGAGRAAQGPSADTCFGITWAIIQDRWRRHLMWQAPRGGRVRVLHVHLRPRIHMSTRCARNKGGHICLSINIGR